MHSTNLLRWGLALVVCLSAYTAPVNPPQPAAPNLESALGRPLDAQEAQEFELVARLHTTISVMYPKVVKEGEAIQAQTGQVPGDDHWHELINRIGVQVVEDFRPISRSEANRQMFLGWLSHLNLSHISHGIYEVARTQGVPAASAVAFGAFMDFGAPAFCALIGHPELGPFTWLVPFEIPGYTFGHVIQNKFLQWELTRLYGGKEAYQKFRQPILDNIERLHLDGLEDMLIPLATEVAGKNGVVISDASGMFENLMARLGITTRRMNYRNLTRFSRNHGVDPQLLKILDSNSVLPEQLKTIVLLHYLGQKQDPRVLADLAANFSRAFVEIEERPEFASLTPWIREFASARSVSDLHRLMRSVPPGTPATLVAQLWRETILPMFVKNNPTIGFWQSMHLKSRFNTLFADASSHPDEMWSESWADRFVGYTRTVYSNDQLPPAKAPKEKTPAPLPSCNHGFRILAS